MKWIAIVIMLNFKTTGVMTLHESSDADIKYIKINRIVDILQEHRRTLEYNYDGKLQQHDKWFCSFMYNDGPNALSTNTYFYKGSCHNFLKEINGVK